MELLENLPFGDSEFDAVTIAFGLRNVTDKDAALREIHRVLRPGGQVIVAGEEVSALAARDLARWRTRAEGTTTTRAPPWWIRQQSSTSSWW